MLLDVSRIRNVLLRNRMCRVYFSLDAHESKVLVSSLGRDCFSAVLPNDREFQQKKSKCAYVSKVELKSDRDGLIIRIQLPAEKQQCSVNMSVYAHVEAMKTTALWYATKVRLSDLIKRCAENERAQTRITQTDEHEVAVSVSLPKRDILTSSMPVSLVLSPATGDSPVSNENELKRRSSSGLLLQTETLPSATVTLIDVPIGQRDASVCQKTLELGRFASGRVWFEQKIQKPARKSQCAHCKSSEVSTVCLPCGHLCLCSTCARKLVTRRNQHYKSISHLYERVALQLTSEGLAALDSSLISLPTAELVEKIRCPICEANAEPVEIVRSADQYKSLLHDQTLTINTHIENETFQSVIDYMKVSCAEEKKVPVQNLSN